MVRYTVKKCDVRPLYFAQNYPQNAGNFRDPKFKILDPLQLCRHYSVLGQQYFGPPRAALDHGTPLK